MRFSTEQTVPARYLEGLLLHYDLPELQTYTRTGVAEARCWLEALAAVHKQPAGDIGDSGLILGLRLLTSIPFSAEDNTLTAFASDLVFLWARAVVDAAHIHTYTNPRFERLRQFTRLIRELDEPLIKAGIEVLVSVLFDSGEDELTRDQVAWVLGELGRHAPVQAYFTALLDGLISPSEVVKHAWQWAGNQAPLEPLLTAVRDKDGDQQVREQALYMLGRRGKPDVVEVLLEVSREDDLLANAAIDALALLGEHIPVAALGTLLLNDNGWGGWKRVHAARALGKLDQDTPLKALMTALDTFLHATDAEVSMAQLICEEIADALIAIPAMFPYEQLVAWLSDENIHRQRIAVEKLALLDHEVPVEPLLLILRNPEQHKAYTSTLRIFNKQAFPVPVADLMRLLQEISRYYQLPTELLQAFCQPGLESPVKALLELLTDASNRVALRALTVLEMLQQPVPPVLLLTRYEPDDARVDSRDAEWGRALLRQGKILPAEQLIKIACVCAGYIEDYNDQDMVERLGALGEYIVDALLAKLPLYGVLDVGFLIRVASHIYEQIPEGKLNIALQRSEGDICLAAGILAVAGDAHYQPILLSLLEEYTSRPEIYCKLLSAFARWRERFPIEVLLTALQHEYKSVRETAIGILRELQSVIDTSRLVEPLKARIVAAVQNNPELEHYWYASDLVEALGVCGEYAPIEFLTTLLDDDMLSDPAAEALGEVGQYVPFEVFFTMLSSENEYIRNGALTGIGKQKEHVPVGQLLILLASCEENDSIADAVVEVLVDLDEYASVERLQTFLQQPDEQVRLGASRALAELETRSPLDRVTRKWRSNVNNDFVRQSVVAAQAALGERAPFALWIEALDKDGRIQEGVVDVLDALARVVPAKMIDLALECDLPEMRIARLRAWSMLGQVESIIATARSDKHNDVRQRAIEILGALGDPVAIEPLTQLLRDNDNSRLRLAIFDALGTFGSAVAVEPLLENCGYSENEHQWASFRREPDIEAADVLKRAHPEAFRALVPLAENILRGDPPTSVFASRTQSRIADAIGAMGRAEPELLAILDTLLDWPNWQVRFKAAEAFGKVGRNNPEPAIEPLLKLLFDPQSPAIRQIADDALAEILSLEKSL